MTGEQIFILIVLATTLSLFVWGRWRYDLVALLALLAVVFGGVVPVNSAFTGFGHPAVITVAAILVISRTIQGSGVIGWLVRCLDLFKFGVSAQVAVVSGTVAFLSGFMNNVGALALLLPVVLQFSRNYDREPGELLMPLAFGSLLGGLTTMVGTPPNIIVTSIRNEMVGAPFSMFDFTPVGLPIAIIGVTFIAFLGWRLIPIRPSKGNFKEMFNIQHYVTEVLVPRKSGLSGTTIKQLLSDAGEDEVTVIAIIRKTQKLMRPAQSETLRINDHLLIQGESDFVESILHNTPLKLVGNKNLEFSQLDYGETGVIEVVVKPGSPLAQRSIEEVELEKRYGIHLLSIARHGHPVRERLRAVQVRPGDILLLQGNMNTIPEVLEVLGCLPLRERDFALHREPTVVPLVIFITAIGFSMFGIVSAPVAFVAAVVGLILCNQIPVREIYTGIDWSVIVLLGAMIPVGTAMEISGVNNLLAQEIAFIAGFLPPWGIVLMILIAAMVLSDIMNNAATAILMSQLAIQVAMKMEVNADPLLMAVAVGSSCAFLTPIGHQSNILVMGPGGYRFGDYWRMGLPLEIIIVLVAVPTILMFWPL